MRRRTKKLKDRKVFRQTAKKTQVVNVRPIAMRGGIRL